MIHDNYFWVSWLTLAYARLPWSSLQFDTLSVYVNQLCYDTQNCTSHWNQFPTPKSSPVCFIGTPRLTTGCEGSVRKSLLHVFLFWHLETNCSVLAQHHGFCLLVECPKRPVRLVKEKKTCKPAAKWCADGTKLCTDMGWGIRTNKKVVV